MTASPSATRRALATPPAKATSCPLEFARNRSPWRPPALTTRPASLFGRHDDEAVAVPGRFAVALAAA